MYTKGTPVQIRSSASLLYNNFDVLPSKNEHEVLFSVVHKSTLWLFNPLAVKDAPTKTVDSSVYKKVVCKGESLHSSSIILQAKWCVLPSRKLLVITSSKGAQMFEADGSIMVFWQALTPNVNQGQAQYARGITAVGDRHICIGVADGGILVFDVPSKGNGVKLQETISGHDISICDLSSYQSTMVSTDESGKIILWKAGGHFQKLRTLDGYGHPCSSVRLWKTSLVAAYGSGHVRIFNTETGHIKLEVAAHAKWINAIDIAEESGTLLTSSEDSYVRVWDLNNFKMLYQECAGDVQITGARFLDQDGSSFGITGYDVSDVLVFQKN